jgi:hypothetical protein
MYRAEPFRAVPCIGGRQQMEEQEMTENSTQSVSGEWEFKILCSPTGKFRDPKWLQTVLAEEALAGWTLLEKFDGTKLRLKRPVSARARDAALPFDARRTSVGPCAACALVPYLLCALACFAAALSLAAFFHTGGAH